MPDKSKYQSVPDVDAEQVVNDAPPLLSPSKLAAAKEKYGFKGSQQIELLAMMDGACDMKPTFDFATLQPDELASQGASYVKSLLAPTVSVVCTTALAWLLNISAQGDAWISHMSCTYIIPTFPYWNALVVFAASFLPMQQRFMKAMEPVFQNMDSIQATAQRTLDRLALKVDETVDRIQAKVHQVLEPYLGKLAMATQMETLVHKVKPSLDIPDPSDIDREFDQAQGLVQGKLHQAKEQVDLQAIIPTVLQSSQAFFWRIVVPFGVLALAIQLTGVAMTPSTTIDTVYTNTTLHDTVLAMESQWSGIHSWASSGVTKDNNDARRNLLWSWRQQQLLDDGSSTDNKGSHSSVRRRRHLLLGQASLEDAKETTDTLQEEASTAVLDAKQAANDIKSQTQDTIDDVKDKASAQVENLKTELNTIQNDVTTQANAAMNEMQTQANGALVNATATYNTLRDQAQDQLKPMLTSIAMSYLIALLQLAVAYLLTSDKFKAFCVNLALKLAKRQVDKALQDSGVPQTMDEVLVTRMERIRDKLLKIFRVVGELDEILDKIPGGSGGAAAAAVAAGGEKAGKALGKVSGVFQRFKK